jgi:hypothetical protein
LKVVPGMGMIIAGCTDDMPAKCFNFKTGGNIVNEFYKLKRSCFTIDISRDGTLVALGDYTGQVQVDNIVYASL